MLALPAPGHAQGNPFGSQARARAASSILAVQQGISALPPTAGQSFVYDFDPALGVPVRSTRLGPIVLFAPETIEQGTFSLRGAASYFALGGTLGPIDNRLKFSDGSIEFARFGSEIDSKVGVFDFTLSYGVTERIEAHLDLPLVLVDANASLIYSGKRNSGVTALGTTTDRSALDTLPLRTQPYSALGFEFNDGTHIGVGRISIGAKGLVYAKDPFRLALGCDFYFPSPQEDNFAGSDSASILPRVIGVARLTDWMRLHADAGYEYDFDVSQLRRFAWDVGISLPFAAATFDLGVGGSLYDTPITWTPARQTTTVPGLPGTVTVTALGDNQLGTNYVSFLAGAKVALTEALVLTGAVNVPVTDPGLQPVALGTVALEVYF
jgi:hypothetical protein